MLLDRHRQAMGGNALSQLQSVRVDGVIDYPNDAWRFVADRRRPNELRLAAYRGDSLISAEGFTGTTAWSSTPGSAVCALSSRQGSSIQRDAEFFSPLLSGAPDGATLELVGSTRVDDAEAYDIHVTRGDGFQSDYLVDATSYLLLRKREVRAPRAGEAPIPIETAYYDYRPVAGVLYPFVTVEREQADGKLISVTVLKRVEPNSVDAAAMAPGCAAKS
ncbi:MAG TPA: hypothetical protein VEI06_12230 [Gemmatimonadaceae bacterium]|nr:hypothetical protein [Gemmatimonadaceae bacterium]